MDTRAYMTICVYRDIETERQRARERASEREHAHTFSARVRAREKEQSQMSTHLSCGGRHVVAGPGSYSQISAI